MADETTSTSIWAKIFGGKSIDENSSPVEVEQAATEVVEGYQKQIADLEAEKAELQAQLDAASEPEAEEVEVTEAVAEEPTPEASEPEVPTVDLSGIEAKLDELQTKLEGQGETIATLETALQTANQTIANVKAKGVQAPAPNEAGTSEALVKAIDKATASGGVKVAKGTMKINERPK